MTKIAIAFLAWIICSLAQAADLSGVPRVVDGDTLAIGATKVRLEGIDAPETDQVCLNANDVRWTCGFDARNQLAAHIGSRTISCSPNGTDAYKRTLAICSLAGEDLNAWMVQQGWALVYVRTRPHTERSKTMREHISADCGEALSLRRGIGVIGILRLSSSAL
jgi:endonuclease YncB( thermonuclease family)